MQHYIAKSNVSSMCYCKPCRSLDLSVLFLLLLTFCLLLLPLWESVIVLCFVLRYLMSILVVDFLFIVTPMQKFGLVSFVSVVVDFLFIVTPIVGVCNCSMFCFYVTLCPFQYCNHLDGEES